MRRFVLIGLVTAAVALLSGCATLTKTPEDVTNTWSRSFDRDMRMLSHDINVFWLADRPSRLTEWYTE